MSIATVKSRGLLDAPALPLGLSGDVQWIGGVGAGSWFQLLKDAIMEEFQYRVRRYDPEGNLEFDEVFYLQDRVIQMTEPYKFTYLSHCMQCTIEQGSEVLVLRSINT